MRSTSIHAKFNYMVKSIFSIWRIATTTTITRTHSRTPNTQYEYEWYTFCFHSQLVGKYHSNSISECIVYGCRWRLNVISYPFAVEIRIKHFTLWQWYTSGHTKEREWERRSEAARQRGIEQNPWELTDWLEYEFIFDEHWAHTWSVCVSAARLCLNALRFIVVVNRLWFIGRQVREWERETDSGQENTHTTSWHLTHLTKEFMADGIIPLLSRLRSQLDLNSPSCALHQYQLGVNLSTSLSPLLSLYQSILIISVSMLNCVCLISAKWSSEWEQQSREKCKNEIEIIHFRVLCQLSSIHVSFRFDSFHFYSVLLCLLCLLIRFSFHLRFDLNRMFLLE